ncbi:MAG: hypothetical protein ACKO2P_06180, partial [Planctomycetota bacterium]
CDSVAVARLLAVTGLLLSEHPPAPAAAPQTSAAPQTDTRTLASARPDWDAWVRSQLTAVTENTPRWSLTTALQLAADASPRGDANAATQPHANVDAPARAHADAAVLSTAVQLFAPVGSQPLLDADGHWLGIRWRQVSERRRQRVQPLDPQTLAGLETAYRHAAARGELELCEHSAPAVAAACQHTQQPAAARQLLEHLQRESAAATEQLAALFLQQAISECSPSAALSMEFRLQLLKQVLEATPLPQRSRSAVRARALLLPAEWLQQLPTGDVSATDRQQICTWWLNQAEEDSPATAAADTVSSGSGFGGHAPPPGNSDAATASAEGVFQHRCGQLLQALVPVEERPLLQLLVRHAPQEALQAAKTAATAIQPPLRAIVLLAAAASESADLPALLAAAEHLLKLRPQTPLVVLLAADCRQRAGMFAAARDLLQSLPPGLPAMARQRSFRLLELATLLRDTTAVDSAAQELAGMELASGERRQLLSMLRISGTPSLLLELQQRQSSGAAVTKSSHEVLQQLQQLEQLQQTGNVAAAAPLARQVISSEIGRGSGGVRFRRQSDAAAATLREQAWDVLRQTGELDRWIDQQQQALRDAPESKSVRRQLTEALLAAGRTAEAAELRAAPVPPALPATVAAAASMDSAPALRRLPEVAAEPNPESDWRGTAWPACGPLPVRVIQQRLQTALDAVKSAHPEEAFEKLLGIEEQDAVRTAAWLAKQTPPVDPVSLSALQRLAVSQLTAAGISRLTARRLERLRQHTDPGPSWTGTRGLPEASTLAATARRGPRNAQVLRQQLLEMQTLAPEDTVLIEVLSLLSADR